MLKLYDNVGSRDEVACDLSATQLPPGVVWLDLYDPTTEELRYVERFARVDVASDESLTNLQTSSRLRFEGDTLQVFTPVLFRNEDSQGLHITTVGFILTPTLLVTVRTEPLRSFTDYIARKVAPGDDRIHSPTDVFVGLLETIVDRMTDAVEKVGNDLDGISRQIFNGSFKSEKGVKPVKYEAELEEILQRIGRLGELTSNIRDSILGLGRLVGFVTANVQEKLPSGIKTRFKTLRQDITSLNDYETRLTDKVQFLLDSTLGFINIDQNRLFRLLTIASVIGIPPTFVVGLYGMNFKSMPEYDWTYGYAWGLALIAISIVVPAIWLRVKGWF